MNDFIKQCLKRGVQRFFSGNENGEKNFSGGVTVEQHRTEEFLFVLDGWCSFACGGRDFRAGPGDFFRIAPWLPHQFGYRPEDGGLLHLWGTGASGVPGACCWNLMQVASGAWTTLARGRYPDGVWQYAQTLADAADAEPDPAAQYAWRKLASDLLLAEVYRPKENNGGTRERSRAAELVELIRRIVDSTLGKACSLDRLAELSGYCPSHLSHTFKQTTGESIGAYIDRVRRDYLADASAYGLRQKEIASTLGFSSASAFRLWKKRNS